MYSEIGRPSIPPERLLGARLLAALFSVPSDLAFCERLHYDLLSNGFWTSNSRRSLSMRAPSAKTSNGSWNTKSPMSSLPKWSAYCGKETC